MKADSLLRLTLLAHRVVAFYGAIGEGGELDDISVERWESWFKSPNATGSYSFDGYNVSSPFPPNETLSGWKATIAVANVTEDESRPYPGTNIAIRAPENVELPAKSGRSSNESDWHICVYFWQPLVLAGDALDDGQDDDGSCTSFLSDECLSALKNISSSSFWNNKTLRCDDPPRMPSECEDYYHGNSLAHIRSFKWVQTSPPLMEERL
ncbi:hypothetical protein NW762_012498 [Fusarium torreyae]|uniref:Uncharacterized protein n=1 Tax=Fusarium torreyae TaxID=1237075 RepID=A0A9W8V8G9_9HYPO|nr:hypothetical protein NW762_012498 [Fusarium torreyae]